MNAISLPRRKKGFSIVELIIVIVVVALLSTLVIVNYSNVRVQSENTRTIGNVKQYVDAINLYRIRNGAYPVAPGESGKTVAMVCLGTGYPSGKCGVITSKETFESASFMTDLQNGSGSDISAIVNVKHGAVGGESFIGAAYGVDQTDSEHSSTLYSRTIQWFLAGEDRDCGINKAWAYRTANGNTACEINFEEVQ